MRSPYSRAVSDKTVLCCAAVCASDRPTACVSGRRRPTAFGSDSHSSVQGASSAASAIGGTCDPVTVADHGTKRRPVGASASRTCAPRGYAPRSATASARAWLSMCLLWCTRLAGAPFGEGTVPFSCARACSECSTSTGASSSSSFSSSCGGAPISDSSSELRTTSPSSGCCVMPKRACNCINSSALPWSRRLCHWAGAVPAPCTAWGSDAFADRVLRSARPSISELSGAVLGRGMSNWFASARRTAFRCSWCISFVCSSPLVGSVRPFPLRQGATRTGLCATQQDEPRWSPFRVR